MFQDLVWLPDLFNDLSVQPELGWLPVGFVWYLSVAAIVAGHMAAVFLAHRQALIHRPDRALLGELPLVVLMLGYTVLSLWIIGQPITVEPA